MASEFMFHEVTEKEKQEIQKRAKEIMDSFSKKLEAIDESKLEEPLIEHTDFERQEGDVGGCDLDREIMFENAPNSNKDFILGEKKSWK